MWYGPFGYRKFLYEIDYFLMGMGFDLELEDVPKGLNLNYDMLRYGFLTKEITTKEFLDKAKKLLQGSKEE